MRLVLFAISLTMYCVLSGCTKKNNTEVPANNSTGYDFSWSTNPMALLPVAFQSTAPAGSNCLWNFGDGDTSVEDTPKHVYDERGTYTVTLTINGDIKHVISKNINVAIYPYIDIEGTFLSGGPIQFKAVGGDNMKHVWYFGDGDTSTNPTPTHVYSNPGKYFVHVKLNKSIEALGSRNIEIQGDALYTNKIPSSKIWHLHVHITDGGSIDTSFSVDETETITYNDKNSVYVNGSNYIKDGVMQYITSQAGGNVQVYSSAENKLYYDHVMDTLYITSNFMRPASSGSQFILIKTTGRP